MLCNYTDAEDAPNSTTFLHPHDPSVEKEYENLIKSWKDQLIDKIPPAPSNDYVRFAWMRLMDHYLDQQWLDSKQMLQCAQAWSARESISLSEAVHTMNILSLKSMQRSLDTRQELLQALGDPDFMVGFGVSPLNINGDDKLSIVGSEQDYEEDEVHAPLLVKHNKSVIEEPNHTEEELTITTEEIINNYHNIQDEDEDNGTDQLMELTEIKLEINHDRHNTEDEDKLKDLYYFNRPRITSSSSTPNIMSLSKDRGISNEYSGFTRKYESFYQQPNSASSWNEIDLKKDDINTESNQESNCSDDSQPTPTSESNVQWKSWFFGDHQDGKTSSQKPEERKPIIFEEEFADEKVETDDSLSELLGHQKAIADTISKYGMVLPSKHKENRQPYLMVRSESSISAFRPISNNLAPRCQKIEPSGFKRSSSSYDLPNNASFSSSDLPSSNVNAKGNEDFSSAKITKSKSFPSKIALSDTVKKSYSPPPIPQKERNFMIRSIVNKKASLSKLFSNRKPSTSSSSSNTSSR